MPTNYAELDRLLAWMKANHVHHVRSGPVELTLLPTEEKPEPLVEVPTPKAQPWLEENAYEDAELYAHVGGEVPYLEEEDANPSSPKGANS